MRIIQVAVATFFLVLTACSTLPGKLQTAEGESLALFVQTDSQYQINLGKQARWGGVIADVTNLKDQTMLEIVYFPLANSGRPKVKNETEGRFRAFYDGFLDPMVYKKGKSVTVLGRLQEKVTGTIGEHEYQYPVLAVTYAHLWKEIQQVDARWDEFVKRTEAQTVPPKVIANSNILRVVDEAHRLHGEGTGHLRQRTQGTKGALHNRLST